MKRPRIIALVALFAFASCTGGQQITGDLRTVGSVTVAFKVDPAQAKIGQPVQLALRLVNYAPKIERLTFPSGQRYDFWATEAGHVVWRWSRDQVFVQEITHDEIGSQGSIRYAKTWKPTKAGTYTMHARLTAEGYAGEMRGKLTVS
jgi:hypothetical protein